MADQRLYRSMGFGAPNLSTAVSNRNTKVTTVAYTYQSVLGSGDEELAIRTQSNATSMIGLPGHIFIAKWKSEDRVNTLCLELAMYSRYFLVPNEIV